jgi:hypothetical protein
LSQSRSEMDCSRSFETFRSSCSTLMLRGCCCCPTAAALTGDLSVNTLRLLSHELARGRGFDKSIIL